ncbi:autotransporter outer membrane beta-barrel domain-containing protein [Candidatus Pantoea floridensis]|uniref:Autotransporter family porin n=1 Tax=Candidatus Pantoea floridensis TaxID=1938870 RepID=A0A286BR98_9GAMM|nr:autotransporter outer membrane beta-barrel domain-containing protein [Pantoea floridensis]PIF23176.1 autotransporter family porin [Enterobacteriaceae bacterium JKS000233]SOD36630.1 autotransporter family porin [Pantoea floridensis]
MNKNYRVIWNHSQGNYVVTSELARGKVKSSSSASVIQVIRRGALGALITAAAVGLFIQPAFAAPAYGEYASGQGNILDIKDKDVNTTGADAHGLFVEKNATAYSSNVNFNTSGSGAYAVYVTGAGSNINVSGGSVTTTGAAGHGLVAGKSGNLTASDITINSSGKGVYANAATIKAKNLNVNAAGFGVHGLGKGALVDIADSTVNVAGNGAYAVAAETSGKVSSTNVDYITSGEKSYGGWVGGGSQLDITGGSITATGAGSYGIFTKGSGILHADGVTVNSARWGVYSENSAVTLKNMHITSGSSGIYATGSNAIFNIEHTDILSTNNGAEAVSFKKGASGILNHVNVETTGDKAYAIYASGQGSTLTISDTRVTTHGAASYGIAALDNAQLFIKDVQVASTGYGLYANKSTLDVSNANIDAQSSGIYGTGDGTSIKIDNSTISGSKNGEGAVYISGAGASATVSNSKLISSGENNSGLTSQYSSAIDANNVDIEITHGGIGTKSTYDGKLKVSNSTITSLSGGTAFSVQSGSSLTADNMLVNLNNSNNSGIETIAIHTGNAYLSSNNPTASINNSTLNVKGDNGIGILTRYTESDINLNSTSLTVENGPAVLAYNAALTTINLDNSVLSGSTLLEAGKLASGEDAGADVRGITLNASNHSLLQGDINIERSKTLNSTLSLNAGSTWRGAAHDLQNLTLGDNSSWNITGDSTVDNLTAKDSTISFDHSDGSFKNLTVNGNYHADNAKLVMNLALGDDNSATDHLHITGDSSGTTKVQVHNAGGKGDATLQGIELIKVDGNAAGKFEQDGRIVGGAWDYDLVQGDNGKWQLTSWSPVDPTTPVDPTIPVDPGITPPEHAPRARPEVGSYIANLAAANNLFTLSAADRSGITEYRDPMTGKMEKTTLWLRNKASHNRFDDSTGQLKSTTNIAMTQLGGDVAQWSLNGSDRFSLGVMAGYGNAKSHTKSTITGYTARGQINGYSGGVYANWQQDSVSKTGAYADSWLAYSTFNNSVKGDGIGQESYKSHGLSASLEGGYTFAFGEQQQYRLQPKAQAVWMGVKPGDYTEQNGTHVSATGNNNVQTRAGVRAAMKSAIVEPYAEVNWLHNTQRYGSQLDGVKIEQAGARNIGEVKLGMEAKVLDRVGVWGGVAQQVGGKGFSESSASLGVNVSF